MWKESNNTLVQKFIFKDFKEAWLFMGQVAQIAEELNHHPSWTNTYNTVAITLSTHDKGGIITDKDHILAERIDEIAKQFNK